MLLRTLTRPVGFAFEHAWRSSALDIGAEIIMTHVGDTSFIPQITLGPANNVLPFTSKMAININESQDLPPFPHFHSWAVAPCSITTTCAGGLCILPLLHRMYN